jgi:RHS repeat-associated protein
MTYQRSPAAAKDFYYGYDPLGSVSQLIDDSGNVQASYGYTAYGDADPSLTDERSADDPAQHTSCEKPIADKAADGQCGDPTSSYRYTDKRFDPGSGSLDMGARRFSPDPGRFMQEDVLNDALGDLGLSADPLSGDRYALAGGNPVNFVEQDGHMTGDPNYGGASGTDSQNHTRFRRFSRNVRLQQHAQRNGPQQQVDWVQSQVHPQQAKPATPSHGGGGVLAWLNDKTIQLHINTDCSLLASCQKASLFGNDPVRALDRLSTAASFTGVAGAVRYGIESYVARKAGEESVERLAQDVAVSPTAPRALPLTRSIGRASHNAALREDIAALPRGATDIRVNQQQVNAAGERVGINRPDLQYTLNGVRHYVEYESPANLRGEAHRLRILANDPDALFEPVRLVP